MDPWIQKTRNGFVMAADEVARIHADNVQGEQSIAVQIDMKKWCKERGLTRQLNIVNMYAEAKGWAQEGFNGMEIIQ